jgi:hypothetical protein
MTVAPLFSANSFEIAKTNAFSRAVTTAAFPLSDNLLVIFSL